MAINPQPGAVKVPYDVPAVPDDLLNLPGEKVVAQQPASAFTVDMAHDQKMIPVPATGITLTAASVHVAVGGWHQLFVNFAPSYTGDKTVEWTVDDSDIADVDDDGVVTGYQDGKTATVTATVVAQPTLKATATVNVGTKPKATITKKADVTGKYVTDTVPFTDLFTVTNSAPADYDFTATNGATVSAAGLVTLTATGATAVTAKLKTDATVTATANITGVLAMPTIVKKADVTGKKGGETVAFADMFTAVPATAADYGFVVTPSSAGTVSAAGLLTLDAAATGDVTVKATHKVKPAVTATATIKGVVAP